MFHKKNQFMLKLVIQEKNNNIIILKIKIFSYIIISMPKFNFKKSVSRPFLNNVAKPLGRSIYNTAAPIVNQGLAQLKEQGMNQLKQLGSQALQTLETTPIPVFRNGGRVKGKRGKAKIAQVHAGEYILPVGVAPTKAQKSAVAKKHARARK